MKTLSFRWVTSWFIVAAALEGLCACGDISSAPPPSSNEASTSGASSTGGCTRCGSATSAGGAFDSGTVGAGGVPSLGGTESIQSERAGSTSVGMAAAGDESASGATAAGDPKFFVGKAFELTERDGRYYPRILDGTTSLHFLEFTESVLSGVIADSGQTHSFRFAAMRSGTSEVSAEPITLFESFETPTSDGHRYWLGGATLNIANASDGQPTLTITGTMSHQWDANDVNELTSEKVVIVGKPLSRIPTFLNIACPSSPLEPIRAKLSVPLQAGASAMLVPGSGTSIAMNPEESGGTVTGFALNVVLPMGISYQLLGSGSALGGSAAPASLDCSTVPSKAVTPSDGFESASEPGSELSNHGVPAIRGERSWTGGILRLARPAGTTKLVFDVRRIEPLNSRIASFTVHAGVVGGEPIQKTIELGSKPEIIGDVQASAIQHIELPLTGDGNEVLFETRTSKEGGSRFYTKDVYPWIDDIHLE